MAGRTIRFRFLGDTHDLDASIEGLDDKSGKLGGKFKDTFEKDGAGGLLKMGKEAIKSHPYIAALAAAAAAVGVAMVKATKATIEFAAKADVVAKKARAIGTDAESLQILQGALEMGGVAAETTANSIQKLSVNLGMAAKGSKLQQEALDDLGLTFEQLESVPLQEKIALIADGLVVMTSSSKRAQTAQALLGRGAMDMLAAFDEGGDAIRASSEQVKAAGIISNKVAKESEFLTDAVTIATRQFTRFKDGALEPLIPIVAVLVTKIGDMFQTLSESGVLQATAEAVAFVAEKFIGLTDEVERFKEETAEAAAVQEDSSADLEKYKERLEKWTAVVDEARAEQARLNEQMAPGNLYIDHAKNLQKIADIERELTNYSEQMYEQGKLTWGGRIGALQRVKEWTTLVGMEERKLAEARDATAAASKEASEEEARLAKEREDAAEAEAKRAERAKAYAAARKASTAAALVAEGAWSDATRRAHDERLTGLDAIEAAENRATEEVWNQANEVIAAGGLSAKRKEELLTAAEERITAIKRDHVKKRLALIDEEVDTETERLRDGFWERQQAEFEYYQAVADEAARRTEEKEELRQQDLEQFTDVTNAIGAIAMAALDAIGQATQAAYNERAAAYRETADRIEEIDAALQGELTNSERRRLEAEKANLEEQAAIQKEEALKAWRANKAIAITSAIISTALAVINGLTTMPFPAGVVAAVVAGVAGAASIAAIASEPQPTLHSGGMVPALQAASRASDEVTIRARKGEAVLSPAGVAAAGGPGGVAAMNRGGAGGGGQTVNLIRVGPRTTEAIVHDTLRVPSSNLSRALGAVRPRVGRHDPRSRKV